MGSNFGARKTGTKTIGFLIEKGSKIKMKSKIKKVEEALLAVFLFLTRSLGSGWGLDSGLPHDL